MSQRIESRTSLDHDAKHSATDMGHGETGTVVALLTLAGAFLGGIVGFLPPLKPTHFSATATVVMVPTPPRPAARCRHSGRFSIAAR